MITRSSDLEKAKSWVDVHQIPDVHRSSLVGWLASLPGKLPVGQTSILRRFFQAPELRPLHELSNNQLARIFRCSATLIWRARDSVYLAEGELPEDLPRGRPPLLSREGFATLEAWVRERSARKEWVLMSEFKRRVFDLLESENVEKYPSRQYFYDLVDALMGAGSTAVRRDR